jgi:hypothetical protein
VSYLEGTDAGACGSGTPGQALAEMLEGIEQAEKIISAKRRRLHEQIDFLTTEKQGVFLERRLEKLDREEKELSDHRRRIHEQIDRMREEAGLPHYRDEQRRRLDGTVATPEMRRTCILIELANGSLRCFDFQDENLAAGWYQRCRDEWRAERPIMIPTRRAPSLQPNHTFPARGVIRLEISTPKDAMQAGAKIIPAVIKLDTNRRVAL